MKKIKRVLKNIAYYPIVGMLFCAFCGLADIKIYDVYGYGWLVGFWICFAVLYVIVTFREIERGE